MKLPRRRRRPAPEPMEPASTGPAGPILLVLIFSNTGLSGQEFSTQAEQIRRVASYDSDTRSWYRHLHLDQPERAAEVLTTLFGIARVHGTTIQVRAQSVGEGAPAGQAP